MSSMPPTMPPPNPAAPKKTSPLVWILGGIAVLMFGGMLTCGIVGFLAVRAVKNAGFDPDLMQRNPVLAMAKMASALNSNLELVSSSDRSGTVTMRDKRTGKVVTYKYDADKKSLQIVGDNGEQVTFSGSGNGKDGAVTVQSPEGTMRIGGGVNSAPAWVPVYPGSNPQSALSAHGKDGSQNTITFKTGDEPSKVMTYFQDHLKADGFNVTLTTASDQGGMLQAEDSAKKRTIVVTLGASGGGTEGSVMAVEK